MSQQQPSAAPVGALWVDLSTTRQWQGPPVGIVRTEMMVARELLAAATPGLRFCFFDREQDDYREIAPADAERLLRRADLEDDARSRRETFADRRSSIRAGFETRVGAGIRRLPERLQGPVRAWGAACLQLLGASARVLGAIPPPGKRRRKARGTGPFAAGDRYVSMGLDWDHNNFGRLGEIRRVLGLKVFLMCYDLIPIDHPQYLVPGYPAVIAGHFRSLLACCDAVFAISEHSARRLERYARDLGVPPPPTVVIRLGADVSTAREACLPHLVSKRFVLTVGTLEVRKNHRLLYELWVRMQTDPEFPDPPILVIVGRRGWRVDDLLDEMAQNPHASACVHHLEHVSDAELAWLYNHCLFTVYPSFAEGLGLPVIESLARGKYCLSSNTTALPEAGQGLTRLLDPLDFVAWYDAIKKLAGDDALLAEHEARIRSAYVATTWRETARALDDSIRTIGMS